MGKRKYFSVAFSVDQETLDGLDQLAAHQERNRSQVLRLLVKRAIEKQKKEVR